MSWVWAGSEAEMIITMSWVWAGSEAEIIICQLENILTFKRHLKTHLFKLT